MTGEYDIGCVIDVGCATHGGDASIPYLVEEFKPWLLLGFDPAAEAEVYNLNGTTVSVSNAAAMTHDGRIGFEVAGLRGRVEEGAPLVPCVDLARVIRKMDFQRIALKIDAEGAEYTLIPHLVRHSADMLLTLAWVEWHCPVCGRGGGNEIKHVESCSADKDAVRANIENLERTMRTEMHRWNR